MRWMCQGPGVLGARITGGGIVADSDPQREYEETVNKAQAMAKALAMAAQMKSP